MLQRKTETIDYKIKQTWHAIDRLYNKQAAKHDSTTTTALVLLNIDSKTGTYSTLIGPSIGTDSRSLTRVLLNLEQSNLISRKTDKKDARKVVVSLTKTGKKKKELVKDIVRGFNLSIIKKLGERKAALLIDLLDEVYNLVGAEQNELLKATKKL